MSGVDSKFKNQCKDIAHTFSFKIDLDCVTAEIECFFFTE
jgi:hypothetical protein